MSSIKMSIFSNWRQSSKNLKNAKIQMAFAMPVKSARIITQISTTAYLNLNGGLLEALRYSNSNAAAAALE